VYIERGVLYGAFGAINVRCNERAHSRRNELMIHNAAALARDRSLNVLVQSGIDPDSDRDRWNAERKEKRYRCSRITGQDGTRFS